MTLLNDWQYTNQDLDEDHHEKHHADHHDHGKMVNAKAFAVAVAPSGTSALVVSYSVAKHGDAKAAVYAAASATGNLQSDSPSSTGVVAFAFGYAQACRN